MGQSEPRICQICGKEVVQLNNHVRYIHKTTITDAIADGIWINDSMYVSDVKKQ